MRRFSITLVSFAVLATGASCALAAPDELEQLLFGEAVVAENEPLAASAVADADRVVSEGSPAVSLPETSSYSQSAAWSSPADPQASVTSVSHRRVADVSDAGQAPAAPVSVVPEPSAIVLALVALAYFLLFGRRRSRI